jgi:cytoskeletal protein CcmA (bactofilin family)
MFFKSNTPENARSNATVPSRSAVPSLLSGDIRIKGGVTSSGEVHVDGVIEGDVSAKTLIISERGVINGAVVAQAVRVLGSVNGTISARSVLLARSARVVGDIIHAVLAIEEGAFLRGHCRRRRA